MFGFSRPAGIVWLLIAVAGVFTLAVSLVAAAGDMRFAIPGLRFVVAGSAAETFGVDLPTPRPGPGISQSVGAAISVAAILVLPTHWAVLAVAAAMGLGRRRDWPRRVFNVTQIALSTGAAGA